MDPNNINWFPGHMAKAKRFIRENIRLVDAIAEVTDARIPFGSRNPDILEIIGNKPYIVVLNKGDLADINCTKAWVDFYKRKNIISVMMDCSSGKGIDFFKKSIKRVMEEKLSKWASKGMVGKTVKVMITGTPNTGKSSLINRLSGKNKVKAENRPGVTKGSQWISIDKNIELLDTPGILPPKINSEISQKNLAAVGSIKDDIIDVENIALYLLDFLYKNYPGNVKERYKIDLSEFQNISSLEIMKMISIKRGFLLHGGEMDLERTSRVILSEFRQGKLGKITLEKPD